MKQKIIAVAFYACAGCVIFASFMGGQWAPLTQLPSLRTWLLISTAIASVATYAWLLCDPEPGTPRRMLALTINCGAAAILTIYLLLVPISAPPMEENPPVLRHAVLVVLPLALLLASFVIISKRRRSRVLATIGVLTAWPLFVYITVIPAYLPDDFGFTSALFAWFAYALTISPVMFTFAAVLVFAFSRLGHLMGVLAGCLAIPWFALTELTWFHMSNSWIALNISGTGWYAKNSVASAEMRILAVAVTVVAIAFGLLRLAPARWTLRKRPVCERTWPALVVCIIVLAIWFSCAVSPYRLPGIVDQGIAPDLKILHVEKRGLQFHEMTIGVFRNTFYISRNDRRLFQYQFDERISHGVLPARTASELEALKPLPQLKGFRIQPPKALRAWKAEGWYVYGVRTREGVFTTEHKTTPPREIVDLFHEIEGVRPTEEWGTFSVKDVCLGFCYDPLAGLGLVHANNRCFTVEGWKPRCW